MKNSKIAKIAVATTLVLTTLTTGITSTVYAVKNYNYCKEYSLTVKAIKKEDNNYAFITDNGDIYEGNFDTVSFKDMSIVTLKMDDNGTKDITDDKIIGIVFPQ